MIYLPFFNRGAAIRVLVLFLFCSLGSATAGVTSSPPDHLTVDVAGQKIAVWSRRPEHPRAAVVLVHGRTFSARPDFDFEPRSGSRSLLKSFARAGFATYAIDLPGYGSSPRDPSGWISPQRAAEDVEAVIEFVAQRHPGLPAPALLGWSRGSKISALVATRARQTISALVLYAYNLDPNAPPDNGPASGTAPAVRNTAEWARSDFISPAVASPELIQDFVDAALAADPVKVDVCCDLEFREIHPESIKVPTLMIYGARDPAFKPAVASAFFSQLATPERRWVIVGAGDHAVHLEDTAPEVDAAMVDFLRASVAQRAVSHPDN